MLVSSKPLGHQHGRILVSLVSSLVCTVNLVTLMTLVTLVTPVVRLVGLVRQPPAVGDGSHQTLGCSGQGALLALLQQRAGVQL